MALSISALASQMKNSVDQMTDPSEVFPALIGAVNTYLTANLEIKGSYVGVLPNGNPSPLSGPHTWKATIQMNPSAIQNSVANKTDPSQVQSSLAGAFKSELTQQFLILSNGAVTVSSTLVGCNSLSFDFSAKPTDPADTHQVLAQGIINGITSSLPNPASPSAVGTDTSTGTVSFSSQE